MVFAVEMSSEENIVTVSEVADLLHQQYAIITGKPKSNQKIEMSNNYYISLIYISYILVHVECFLLEVSFISITKQGTRKIKKINKEK